MFVKHLLQQSINDSKPLLNDTSFVIILTMVSRESLPGSTRVGVWCKALNFTLFSGHVPWPEHFISFLLQIRTCPGCDDPLTCTHMMSEILRASDHLRSRKHFLQVVSKEVSLILSESCTLALRRASKVILGISMLPLPSNFQGNGLPHLIPFKKVLN